MKTKSKSKTFQKDDNNPHEMLDFVMDNIDTYDDTPQGYNMSGGEPTPYDPVERFKHKYIITITRIEDDPPI